MRYSLCNDREARTLNSVIVFFYQPTGTKMETPVQVEKYGKTVWHLPTLDGDFRKDNCMCLNCGSMKPGKLGHCTIAQDFFAVCSAHGNAFVLTRCEEWKPVEAAA